MKVVCKHCKNKKVYLLASVTNLLGSYTINISATLAKLDLYRLTAKDIKLNYTKLYCEKCDKILDISKDILFQVEGSSVVDEIHNFLIIRATKDNITSRPIIIHKSSLNKYAQSLEKDGYTIKKRILKITFGESN